jgi:iron-sulfur cluster repair protein YtfE (RIC family)
MDLMDVCHQRILVAMGQLSALVRRLSEHGADTEARALARQVLDFFSTTVRQHHDDEERHVFPKLLAGGNQELVQAILRLQTDHNWLEEDWLNLAPQVAAVAEGHSGYDVDLMREWAEVFVALLYDHMILEESLVYPQARAQLDGRERRELGRRLAARRRGHHTGGGGVQATGA